MIKQNGMQITLQKAIINSATITIPGTFLSVYFSSLTAYGIHVYDFKFKKFAWAFIMAVMMVPSQISIIGFYRFMLDLKLIDTYVPLIIPATVSYTHLDVYKRQIDHICDGRISVVSNNIQGMEELVTYIYKKGHRKIAYIHGDDTSVTKNRLGSFYRTLQRLGIEEPDEYVKPSFYRDADLAGERTGELLDLKDPPTCILYPDDYAAMGGINEIRERLSLIHI